MSLLNEIQQKLKVPKSQYNAFAKYNYRNAEDILEAVKPLLGEGTLVIEDEVQVIGDRYYVKATAKLYEKGELAAWSSGWAREEAEKKGMDAAQITGAASSYARKYALNGLFCIDDTKDADNHTPDAPVPPKKASQSVVKPDARELAGKDRIKYLLGVLGHKPATVAEASQIVADLTDMEFLPENYEKIAEMLADKAEAK